MVKVVGFIGLLILYRLNVFYGFDYRRYCVFDVMYIVVLGVVKKYLFYFFDNDFLDRSIV